MKRHLPLVLAVVWIAALFGVRSVVAGNDNGPTTLYADARYNADPVDHQTWCGDCVGPGEQDYTINSPWTVNPGWLPGYTPPIALPATGGSSDRDEGCMWDSDDWFEYLTTGNVLGPKTTLTITECRWAQSYARYDGVGGALSYVVWRSASPDLVFTFKWEWDTGSRTYTIGPPVRSGTQYLYQTCLWAPSATGGTHIAVPGSHDGNAIYELVTITITNPTSRKVGKTGGLIGTDYRHNGAWCPNGWIEV